jgi:rare lipoprotein A
MELAMAAKITAVLSLSSLLVFVAGLSNVALAAEPLSSGDKPAASQNAHQKHALDRSGKTRKGKASYYGRRFYGKKMASGKPMNPQSNVAASKTLPLGTKAKVTNLETGKSETVVIEDRGPYVDGRIIDVSPKTAEKLDLKKEGTAPVQVKPLEVPQQDDGTKTNAPASATGSR